MSLETWKEKFYPEKPTKNMTKKAAIQHSITKWIGLRPENLDKHKLELDVEGDLLEDGKYVFGVNSSSCALCRKYYDDDDRGCQKCPLFKVLDNERCDYDNDSPFVIYRNEHNPEPMIAALEKTLAENS